MSIPFLPICPDGDTPSEPAPAPAPAPASAPPKPWPQMAVLQRINFCAADDAEAKRWKTAWRFVKDMPENQEFHYETADGVKHTKQWFDEFKPKDAKRYDREKFVDALNYFELLMCQYCGFNDRAMTRA